MNQVATIIQHPAVFTCTKCKVAKPCNDFQRNRSIKRGFVFRCKACERGYRKKLQQDWRDAHPGYHRPMKLKYWYGLTHEEYDAMLLRQHGGCAICKRPPKDGEMFCVDHDHAIDPGKPVTNKAAIRGILCKPCNAVVGFAYDNTTILRNAAEYLDNFNPRSPNNRQ